MPLSVLSYFSTRDISKKMRCFFLRSAVILIPLMLRLNLYPQSDFTTLDDFHRHVRRIVIYRLDAIGWGVLGAWISHYLPSLWLNCKKRYSRWLTLFIIISILVQPSPLQIPILATLYFTILSALLMLLLPKIETLSISNRAIQKNDYDYQCFILLALLAQPHTYLSKYFFPL
jgi:hypothetical protein